ncbi:hypothetical protein Pf1_01156 [Flavobacterium columnare]|uniref:hypothetical protein n=3 Tax=Flavobacterium columnare TaxID=996 RepID=UPI0007F9EE6A|nr:hypothetical protein [Flavobacterium columnare]ANO49401.1 hypothetical protein Pf1_01156 [Flavobacterium columnare]APT22632.1 hypothetical protein BU993_08350 [Flavobacterium columnare]GEM58536.1 hypothetical protein FC1_17740 [Flavobacterium columnare NBRC 100251 = ATCC 23463]
MVDLVLITEDKNDVYFIRDFLIKSYCSDKEYSCKKIKEKEYILEFKVEQIIKRILIRDTNKESDHSVSAGWTKLEGLLNSDFFIKSVRNNKEVKFVILFDADEDKPFNIAKKNVDIDNWLKGKDFQIDRFYLPFNNENSHNLEQLLELSFKQEINDCWEGFTNCLVNEKNLNAVVPTSKKGKIITYKDIYSPLNNNKNEYLSELWNLDVNTNEHLKPLKEFLDQYLK